MSRRQLLLPNSRLGLKVSAQERHLILGLKSREDCLARVVLDPPADEPIQFALDESGGIAGYLVAKASRAEEEKPRKEAANLFRWILEYLDNLADEQSRTGT